MEYNKTSTNNPDEHWTLLMLRQQMKELKREQEHLSSKKIERPLTTWELSRCDELLNEVMELLEKFSNIHQNYTSKWFNIVENIDDLRKYVN